MGVQGEFSLNLRIFYWTGIHVNWEGIHYTVSGVYMDLMECKQMKIRN